MLSVIPDAAPGKGMLWGLLCAGVWDAYLSDVPACVQAANFVRAHKVWRHVCYPGVVPQHEVVTTMQRLSGPANQGTNQARGNTFIG